MLLASLTNVLRQFWYDCRSQEGVFDSSGSVRKKRKKPGRRQRERIRKRQQDDSDDSWFFPEENENYNRDKEGSASRTQPNSRHTHSYIDNHRDTRPPSPIDPGQAARGWFTDALRASNSQSQPVLPQTQLSLSPLTGNNVPHAMRWDSNNVRVTVRPDNSENHQLLVEQLPGAHNTVQLPPDYDPDSRYDQQSLRNQPLPPPAETRPVNRQGIPAGSHPDINFNLAARLENRNRSPGLENRALTSSPDNVASSLTIPALATAVTTTPNSQTLGSGVGYTLIANRSSAFAPTGQSPSE